MLEVKHIQPHCLVFMMVVSNPSFAWNLDTFADLAVDANLQVFFLRCSTCFLLFPSIAIKIPRVSTALLASFLLMITSLLFCPSLILSSACSSSFFLYLHFLFAYLKSMAYQEHFLGTNAPPVALIPPSHWSIISCIFQQLPCLLTLDLTLSGQYLCRPQMHAPEMPTLRAILRIGDSIQILNLPSLQ